MRFHLGVDGLDSLPCVIDLIVHVHFKVGEILTVAPLKFSKYLIAHPVNCIPEPEFPRLQRVVLPRLVEDECVAWEVGYNGQW